MTATANFLAIDLGASSGRVLLARWDGSRFAIQELHRFVNGPVTVMGHMHWDVLRQWDEMVAGLGKYATQSSAPPAGIGVDTWGVDFALLDRNGRLLGNPYHYRDSRTDGVADAVHRRVPFSRMFQATGIQFMPINTVYQLCSMVRTDEQQLAMAATLLMMPDLFHYWLTGQIAGEYTIASTTQMLEARSRQWATGLIDELGIPRHILPPIVAPATVLGNLLPGVAAAAGLSQPAPVIATGSHDTADAVAGIPGLDAGSIYISSGTWSIMGVEIPEPVITEQALALNATNEGGVGNTVRLGKNIAGLWMLQESRRQWQREGRDYGWDELMELAAGVAPFRSLIDPDAPDFLNPPNMIAAMRAYCLRTGQAQPSSEGEVVRCCLESLALKYRRVIEGMESITGRQFQTILIVGGGSQNRLLSQFAADACGRPVVAGPVEATALGNIMVQAVATGHLASIAEGRQAIAASVTRQSFEPHPSAAWDDAYGRFSALLGA